MIYLSSVGMLISMLAVVVLISFACDMSACLEADKKPTKDILPDFIGSVLCVVVTFVGILFV